MKCIACWLVQVLGLFMIAFNGLSVSAQNFQGNNQFDEQFNSEYINNAPDDDFDELEEENEDLNQFNLNNNNQSNNNLNLDNEFNDISLNQFDDFIDDENENNFFNNAASKFGAVNKFNNLGNGAILPADQGETVRNARDNAQAYYDYYSAFLGGRREGVAYLLDPKVTVYRSPSLDADIVGILENANDVHVIAKYGAWYKIGKGEWVDAAKVRLVGLKTRGLNLTLPPPPMEPVESAPVVQETPKPTTDDDQFNEQFNNNQFNQYDNQFENNSESFQNQNENSEFNQQQKNFGQNQLQNNQVDNLQENQNTQQEQFQQQQQFLE